VTLALIPHLPPFTGKVWEPAAANGQLAYALAKAGLDVFTSDIRTGKDFLCTCPRASSDIDAVITNPPYTHAQKFIEHALTLLDKHLITVIAMLLRIDYDSAKTRQHLFATCPLFAKKVVLTRRIRWFPDSTGSPSFNHCWMVWDKQHKGPPTLAYS
jgi:hypothetical protein